MGHDTTAYPEGSGTLDALVSDIVDTRRAIAALQAQEARLLASAVDLVVERTAERRMLQPRRCVDNDLPLREVSAELAAAMRLSDRAVQGRMGDAFTLVSRFRATLAAWEGGQVDAAHVSAILDAGAGIADDAVLERFEGLALAVAETESPTRLRAAARAIAASVDPVGTSDRVRGAQAERRVRVIDLDDGMARLLADLPATLAHAIHDRLTQMARVVQARDDCGHCDECGHGGDSGDGNCSEGNCRGCGDRGDGDRGSERPDSEHATVVTRPAADSLPGAPRAASDPRTLDQVRADILSDLLLAGGPVAHGEGLDAITGHVQVVVPAETLSGAPAGPALLAGFGPIDSSTALRLAGGAKGWDRLVSDPLSGAVLAVDRYRPSSDMTRFLRARDEHCRFPGCRRAARRCDIDHTVDAALGGPTSCSNLAHFCRRHHTLKHATEWRVRQRGHGILEWISPTGRRYADRPPSMVRFVPDEAMTENGNDPPPF